MTDYEFNAEEFTALARQLDTLGDEFTPRERAMLYAVFQMANESIAARASKPWSGVTTLESAGHSELDDAPSSFEQRQSELIAGLENRIHALEAKIGRLEINRISGSSENLESFGESSLKGPTIKLQTSGELPKLSDGFLGSFRRDRLGHAVVGDDVGVGVNVGVMF